MGLNMDNTTTEINGALATVTYDDKKAYEDSLKEAGIDVKVAKELAVHNTAYLTGAMTTAGDLAKEIFGKNKEVNDIAFNFPFGVTPYSKGDIKAARQKSYPIPGKDTVVTKSKLTLAVKESSHHVKKSVVSEIEAELTALFCK